MKMISSRHSLWRGVLVNALVMVLFLAVGVQPSAAREPAPEDAVKAAMLYNFVRFVRWPGGIGAGGQGAVLGLIGRDPLQEWLLDLADEQQVDGFKTVQISSLQELAAQKHGLKVLYIGRTSQRDVDTILKLLDGVPVLTVSDDELFAKQGGMMNFVRQNSRIRFDLNLDAAGKCRLQISSRLNTLARRIVKNGVVKEGR